MAEPSGPLNGQGRVVEGLVMIDGTTAFRRGRNRIARTDGGATQYVADQAMAWPTSVAITQTPTITAGAYAVGDAVGGLLTFADATREAGSGCVIASVIVSDLASQLGSLELWLFDSTFTAMADNGTWSVSDADVVKRVGVIPINNWYSSTLNSVSQWTGALLVVPAGTSLYGQLVTRTVITPTSTSDLRVTVVVQPD